MPEKEPTVPLASPHEKLVNCILGLERFQLEVRGGADKDSILNTTLVRLAGLLPINIAGFYLEKSGNDFALATPLAPSAAAELEAAVRASIASGAFGWALKHPRPAAFKTPDGKTTVLLAALRAGQKPLGMFAATLQKGANTGWDANQTILATFLACAADAILTESLTAELQEHNRQLDVLVTQRTGELERTAQKLAESQRIITAAAEATQILLAPSNIETALQTTAETLGRHLQADRILITTGTSATPIGWMKSPPPDLRINPLPAAWDEAVRAGKTTVGHTIDLPKEQQGWLIEQGIQTILLIAIRTDNVHWGCLRIDSCEREREWIVPEIESLRTIATNIGLALRREQHARQLEEAKVAAEVANRAKSTFLSTVSHELRTPLNAILGYTQRLLKTTGIAEAELSKIRTIHAAAEHLLSLINDLLDLAKAEVTQLELVPSETDIRNLAQESIKIVQSKADEKQLDLELAIGPDTAPGYLLDGRRLKQVFINLLGNAIKFTHTGTVKLEIEGTPAGLRCRISDTGCGIAPEDIRKLCQPFQQLGDIRQRAQGSGLGLAISRRIIQAMGSDFRVESTLLVGSTFEFTLPAERGHRTATLSAQMPDRPAIDLRKIHDLMARSELAELRELCRKGAIPAIRKKLEEIAQRQPDPVVTAVLELAREFKIKSLKQIFNLEEKT
jgi:signal transduction histidine kinase